MATGVVIALAAMALTREHERQRREREQKDREHAQQATEQTEQRAREARILELAERNRIAVAYRAKITQIESLKTSTTFEEDLKRNCRNRFDENSHEAYAKVDAILAFLQLAPITTIQQLIQAITKGQTDVIRLILESKAVAVVANADVFQTIDVNIVRLLIDYGFDPCANDNAAIKFAITNDASFTVLRLLAQRCRDPELLSFAIQQKNEWSLTALLSYIDPTETVFHLAVKSVKDGKLSLACLKHLFDHPRLNVADYTDCLPLILLDTNNSLLKSICRNPGRTEFIQEVLLFLCKSPISLSQVKYIFCAESKCRIFVKTFKQAVEIACENNNPRILEYLLRFSAVIGLDIKMLFKTACANGRLSIVEVLLPAVVNDKETLIAAKQEALQAGHTEICALIRTQWWCACFG